MHYFDGPAQPPVVRTDAQRAAEPSAFDSAITRAFDGPLYVEQGTYIPFEASEGYMVVWDGTRLPFGPDIESRVEAAVRALGEPFVQVSIAKPLDAVMVEPARYFRDYGSAFTFAIQRSGWDGRAFVRKMSDGWTLIVARNA